MDCTAFLIDSSNQSIAKVSAANNSDVYRLVGGTFLTKRTPDNNLIHCPQLLLSEYPPYAFSVRGMSEVLYGVGLITGSRPFRDSPFSPVNFDDLDILWNVVFLTQSADRPGFRVAFPKEIVWSV